MRDDEEHCRLVLDRHLRSIGASQVPVWHDGADPPDYELSWNGTHYHVEITDLFHEHERDGRERIAAPGISAIIDRMVRDITAAVGDKLSGTYVLRIRPPFRALENSRSEIITAAAEVIRNTVSAPSFSGTQQRASSGQRWEIAKVAPNENFIGYSFAAGYGGFDHDVQRDFAACLERCIERKARNEHLLSTDTPLILAIHDCHQLARPEMFAACVDGVKDAERFHSVYIVSYDKAHCVLGQVLNARGVT